MTRRNRFGAVGVRAMHKVELVDGMINGFLCHPVNPNPLHLGPYAHRRREVARIRVELLEPVNPLQGFHDLCPLLHVDPFCPFVLNALHVHTDKPLRNP